MSQYQHQPVVLPHTIIFSENFPDWRLVEVMWRQSSETNLKTDVVFFLIEMDKIQTVPLDYLAIDFFILKLASGEKLNNIE